MRTDPLELTSGPSELDDRHLLEPAGVDHGCWVRLSTRQSPPPADAVAYLSDRNPRLRELRASYESHASPAGARSQWSLDYVARDVPLLGFRGECAYVWQRRDHNTPVRYLLTAAHLRNDAADLFEVLEEDGSFDAYTLPYNGRLVSRDLLDSISEIMFLDRAIGIRGRVEHRLLDIGSGYGRLAHRVTEACPAVSAVLCADAIPESTFICEYYLRFRNCARGRVVPLPDVADAVADLSPDIAVSCHCLDECPFDAIQWWVGLLRRHAVKHLLIVPAAKPLEKYGLASLERSGRRIAIDPLLRDYGYRLVATEPKYRDPSVQHYGVSPTQYLLYRGD